MHCNIFYLLSCTYVVVRNLYASQESLYNKRVCSEVNEEMSETSSASNLHVKSVAKKSCQQNDNVGLISNVEHLFHHHQQFFNKLVLKMSYVMMTHLQMILLWMIISLIL